MDDCVLRGLLSLLACLSQLFLLIKVILLSLSLHPPLSLHPSLLICAFFHLTSCFPLGPQPSVFFPLHRLCCFGLLPHPHFTLYFKCPSAFVPCLPLLLSFLSVRFVLDSVFCINRMHPEGKTHTHTHIDTEMT